MQTERERQRQERDRETGERDREKSLQLIQQMTSFDAFNQSTIH